MDYHQYQPHTSKLDKADSIVYGDIVVQKTIDLDIRSMYYKVSTFPGSSVGRAGDC